ncbi:MAG: PorP/SprF family type IX secretion system membrane protein [Bacteroidales bacterium]
MKKIHLVILGLIISWAAFSQDVRHSQPFSVPLKLNPALMGSDDNINVKLNYRSQWAGIEDGYSTAAFTFMSPVYRQGNGSKLDVGLYVMDDMAGAFNHIEGMLAVNYKLRLSESGHFLSASVYGGFNQKFLDTDGLTFDDQYEVGSFEATNQTSETVMHESINYIDAGFGLMWFYQPRKESNINAFAGISAFHVNQPNESFAEETGTLYAKYASQAGIKITPEGSKLTFTPNILGSTQNGINELATGVYADYAINETFKARIGAWYRAQNTVAFVVGFEFIKIYVGYSYDLPNSALSNMVNSANTHEISLSYYFNTSSEESYKMF